MGKNWILLLWIGLLCTFLDGHRLNVPKVLLPHHSSIPVNFTLEITDPPGSCFRWRSSRPEVATVRIMREEKRDEEEVEDLDKDCSGRAIVSAVSRSAHKMTAVIFAEEVGRGTVLRCDVMVDKIDSIDIITTTREIFLEDAPEEFSVRALNDQGDTFSQLGGLAFEWTLHGSKSSKTQPNGQQILKIIPYSESEYDTPEPIANLEREGLHGHQVLMEGVSTGSGQLTVKPRDPEYKAIKPMTISVLVVANIMLNPSYDIRIPVHGLVHYSVELIKQGKSEAIPMPSPQYFLELSDSDTGELSTEKSEVTGLALGTTEITLKDRNVEGDIGAFHTPSAYIHVVTPGSLHFGVEPGKVWVLEQGRKYEIYLELLDSEAHQVYITKNMRFDAKFPSEYFTVHKTSENGSHFEVTAKKKGHTVLSGTYQAIEKDGREISISPAISGEQGVTIYEPIEMIPRIVVFPWDTRSKTRYQYQLRAKGGSGEYSWASAHRQVATIGETSGMVSTLEIGNSTIVVSDTRNRIHRAHGIVVVTPPTRISFSKNNALEVEMGKEIRVGLDVFGEFDGKEFAFADCHKMGIDISVADSSLLLRSSDSSHGVQDNGCSSVSLRALKVGDTKVTAVYQQNEFILRAETVISVYAPLKMNPGFSPLLAIGSGWTLSFEGGPRPWILDGSKWFAHLEETSPVDGKKDLVTIVPISKSRVSGFHVYCRGIGDAKLTLTVGNKETASNLKPALSKEAMTICCSVPKQLKLSPSMASHSQEQGIPSCPIIESNRLPVPSFRKDFQMFVSGLGSCQNDRDQSYRTFDNMSSLILDWDVTTGADLITLPTKGSLVASVDSNEQIGSSVLGFRYFETIGTQGKEGPVTLSAKINTFHQDPCVGASCELQLIPDVLASVDLILVKSVRADPDTVSVFNHPENKVNVRLLKGSGHFHVLPDKAGIATVTHQDNELLITPRKNGQVTLRVVDLCLADSQAVVDVGVADIRSVEVTGPDLVEVGKTIRLVVRVKDELGRQLSKKYFRFMNIAPLLDMTGLIEWTEDKETSLEDAISFKVKGLAVGNGQFVVKAKRADNQPATSQPHAVQVFAPLQLLPKDITMIPNTEFQLEAIGGPQPRLNLMFSTNQTGLLAVADNTGMMKSNTELGNVKVTGRIMSGGNQGTPKIISEDSVTVHVVALTGVRIKIPITTILSGQEAPVYAVGSVAGQNPHSFVGVTSPLLFEWSIDNSDSETGSLLSVYHKAHVTEEPQNSFARRLLAKQPGRLTIRLKVTVPGPTPKSFSDSVQVTVIEPLQLTSPGNTCNGKLLLTPNTEMALKTNRPANSVHYQIVEDHEKARITINQGNGLLKSGSHTGKAILVVTSQYGNRNESVVYQIEVLPVTYLMVSSTKSLTLSSDSELNFLPLRYSWTYEVSFHDSLGRKLDAANTRISSRPHRFDSTDLFSRNRNRSLQLNLNQPGFAALKVWDLDNTKTVDYVAVPIGDPISPREAATITAGDIICFTSPFPGGKWESEKSKIIEVVGEVGVGFARAAGVTTVAHIVDSDSTKHRVSVSSPSQLRFEGQGKHVTNVPGSSTANSKPSAFVFPVIIGDGSTNIKGTDCAGRIEKLKSVVVQPPIECSMRWETPGDLNAYHVFDVSPRYCAEHGKYYCEVKPLPLDTIEKYSRWSSNLLITASFLQDGTKNPEVRDAVLSVPFYPAFYLYQNEIHLSNVQNNRVVFYISAADHIVSTVKVKTSRNNILRISKLERDGSDPERWQIAVELLTRSQSLWHLYASNSAELSDLHLTIESELTGQERKIPVWIKLYGDTPKLGSLFSTDHFGFWEFMDVLIEEHGSVLLVLLVIIATLAAVYIGYRMVLSTGLYGRNQSQIVANGTPHGYTQWRSYGGPQVTSFMSSDGSSIASPNGGGFDPYQSTQKRQSLGNGNRMSFGGGGKGVYLWSQDRGQTSPNQSPNRSQPS